MRNLLITAFLLTVLCLAAGCGRPKLTSPQGNMTAVLKRDDTSAYLLVKENGKALSKIRVGLRGEKESELFTRRVRMTETTTPPENNYNGYLLRTRKGRIGLRVRMFDNAVAFRYESDGVFSQRVLGEASQWEMPEGTTVWYFERAKNYPYKLRSYAGEWVSADISDMASATRDYPLQGMPLIFEFADGRYGFLSEAGLVGYSGMRLRVTGNNAFKADFTEGDKGFMIDSTLVSPWRVLFTANDLTALVNQDIIRRLSPAPDPKLYADTSYIVPGKSAWSWFSKFTGTPEQERAEIDRAAQLGFNYSTIDEGWASWEESWKQVADLARYAADSKVRLILWKHSREINDPANDYAAMRGWLDSVAASGAAGIKTDFMDSEDKATIDFDTRLLREAAKRRLVVNLHGCQKPSGEQYTFPNEVTREGIRGIELNNLGEGTVTASHNAALPFTRFVVGHGDYTPLSFANPGTTSWAHQLATLICFTSSVQTIAEDTELLLSDSLLSTVTDFISAVPTEWDETLVLDGSRIGNLAIMARRSGETWYVGILNGTGERRTLSLPLGFLMEGPRTAQIIADDMDVPKVMLTPPTHRTPEIARVPVVPFKRVKMAVKRNQEISLDIAPEGGAVIVIK